VPVFGAASGAVALSNLAMYGTLLAVPVVLADRPGWSAADAGLALAMLSVAMIALAPFGGRLADRRGHRLPAAAGLTLLTVSTGLLAAMGAAPSAIGLACALLLGGIGLGLANAAVQTAAIEAVAPRHAGVAAGLFSTARYGGSIGSALLLAALLGGGGQHAQAFFTIAALSAAGSALLALRLGGRPRPALGTPAAAAAGDAR
jgi:MFS family permease